jgi:hypothetical protein
MRLPRMTIREWMIAMVVTALAVGAVSLDRWSRDYRRRAEFHARMESTYEDKWRKAIVRMEKSAKIVDKLERQLPPDFPPGSFRETVGGFALEIRERAAADAQRGGYHAALARKYRYAASHPWLPVEPDPPEPGS